MARAKQKRRLSPTDALIAEVRRLGFVIDDRALEVLGTAIAHANGRRRTGVLGLADVLATVRDAARALDEHAFRIAEGERTVTACLAMREGYARWIVGLAPCRADVPSPAGCASWRLGDWRTGGDNAQLLASWAVRFDPGKVGLIRRVEVVAGAGASDHAARATELLSEITAARDDDAPRLVYADLVSATDPARAEFITASCQAAAMAPGAARDALEKRANELRVAHRRRWERHLTWAKSVSYERGFVDVVEADLKKLIANAPKLFTPPGPAQLLTFVGDVAAFERLLAIPGIETLEGLRLIHDSGAAGDALGLYLATRKPAVLARLRKLAMIYVKDVGAGALADPQVLPSLRRLELIGNLDPATLTSLRRRRGLAVEYTYDW